MFNSINFFDRFAAYSRMWRKMDQFNLQLDYYGALNLHKALLEAKFHQNSDNELISVSPVIADIYIQVRDFLIQNDKPKSNHRASCWKEWFELKNRSDYKQHAIILLTKYKRWDQSSLDEKKKITKNCLAPFFFDETELNAIVTEIDQHRKQI